MRYTPHSKVKPEEKHKIALLSVDLEPFAKAFTTSWKDTLNALEGNHRDYAIILYLGLVAVFTIYFVPEMFRVYLTVFWALILFVMWLMIKYIEKKSNPPAFSSNNNVNLVGLSAGQPDFVKNPPKKRKISLKKAEKIKNPPQFVGHAQTLESIKKKIMKSTAEDWLFDDIQGIYTYKKDVNLTIRRTPYEESEEFHEKWLDVYADRKGHTSNHDIYYSSSFIERIFIVAVDGYRKYIPYPDINDLTLTKYQYAVGRIINDAYGTLPGSGVFTSFDDYLQRAGIKVK